MRKFILAAPLLLLAGCETPPLHAVHVAEQACTQGNQDACNDLPRLQAWRQAYNAKVNHDLAVTATGLLVVGAVVAPIAIVAGSHPHPGPPPVPLGHP